MRDREPRRGHHPGSALRGSGRRPCVRAALPGEPRWQRMRSASSRRFRPPRIMQVGGIKRSARAGTSDYCEVGCCHMRASSMRTSWRRSLIHLPDERHLLCFRECRRGQVSSYLVRDSPDRPGTTRSLLLTHATPHAGRRTRSQQRYQWTAPCPCTGNLHRPMRGSRKLRRTFYLAAQTAMIREGPTATSVSRTRSRPETRPVPHRPCPRRIDILRACDEITSISAGRIRSCHARYRGVSRQPL